MGQIGAEKWEGKVAAWRCCRNRKEGGGLEQGKRSHPHRRGRQWSIAVCDNSRGKSPKQVSTLWFLYPFPSRPPALTVQLWDAHCVFEEDGPDIPGLSEVPSLCISVFPHWEYSPVPPSAFPPLSPRACNPVQPPQHPQGPPHSLPVM